MNKKFAQVKLLLSQSLDK